MEREVINKSVSLMWKLGCVSAMHMHFVISTQRPKKMETKKKERGRTLNMNFMLAHVTNHSTENFLCALQTPCYVHRNEIALFKNMHGITLLFSISGYIL